MNKNRTKKVTARIGSALMTLMLAVPALTGAVHAEEAAPYAETETMQEATAEPDITSKRLLVAAEDASVVAEDAAVISSYNGVYLLQYEDEESAKTAYAYYADAADLVEIDAGIQICEGEAAEAVSTDTVMTEDENPLSALETAKEAGAASYDIALIDTGAEEAHVTGAVSMIGEDLSDENGHGSRMASLIAEENDSVSILSIKAFGSDGRGDISALYAAIEYALTQDVKIISLSASALAAAENAILKDAVQRAVDAGIVFVGAAGNNGKDASLYLPGGIDAAVITGACDETGVRRASSNFGATVDYYIHAETTSEAAARFSGWLSANGFDAVEAADGQGFLFSEAAEQPAEENAAYYHLSDKNGKAIEDAAFQAAWTQPFYSVDWLGDGDMLFYTYINDQYNAAYCIDHGVPNPHGDNYTLNGQTDYALAYLMHYGYPYNTWGLSWEEAQFLTQSAVFGARGVPLDTVSDGLHSPFWIWNHTWGDGSYDDSGSVWSYGNFQIAINLLQNAWAYGSEADLKYMRYWTPDSGTHQRMVTPVMMGNLSVSKSVSNGTGSLVISKVTTGTASDKEKEFTFTLVVKNAGGQVQNVNYSYTGSKSGTISGNSGTVKLKSGQGITVSGIPTGYSYTVTETADDKYTTTPSDRKRTGTIPGGPSGQSFTFTVTIAGGGTYYYSGSKSGSVTSGGTISLKGGESVTIYDLPVGAAYTVGEAQVSGYTQTASGTSGTIELGQTKTARFTNVYTPPSNTASFTNARKTTSLKVTKTSSATGTAASQLSGNSMYSQNFSGAAFSVQVYDANTGKWGTAKNYETADDGSFTATGLYAGDKVRVTETKAPKGYLIPASPSKEVTLTAGSNTVTFQDEPTFNADTPVIKKVKYADGALVTTTSVAGAVFKAEYFDNVNCSGSPKRTWYFKTDANGSFRYARSGLASGYTSDALYVDMDNVPNLPLGSVKFTEVETPRGYKLFEGNLQGKITQNSTTGKAEFSWISRTGGQIQTAANGTGTIGDEELAVAVDKIDSSTRRSVPGAHLQILEGSNVLTEWDTNGVEKVIKGVLLPGKSYVLRETKAPNMYKVAGDIRFSVDQHGSITVQTADVETYVNEEGFLGICMEDIKMVKLPVTGSDDMIFLLLLGSLLFGGGAGAAVHFLKKKKGSGALKKKLAAALIGLTAVAGITTPAFAAGGLAVESEEPGGHSYTAYQLLSGIHLGDSTLWDIHFAEDIPDSLWDRLEIPKDARASTEIAEWISDSIEADEDGSFAVKVAKAVLAETKIEPDAELVSGEEIELPDGYYLVVSDDAQPMLLLIGNGEVLTIQEKSSVPKMEKEIGEVAADGTVTFGDAADSGLDKIVPYRIIGTLPSNYNAYDCYSYSFRDLFDKCLVIDPDSVRVRVMDAEGEEVKDITDAAEITVTDTTMSVEFENLMEAYPVYTEGDVLVVTYDVTITDEAVIGADSNDNYAWIEYTRSPTCERLGKSIPDRCRLYTWELDLSKIAEDTKAAIKGAGFTIEDEEGMFVNTDGTRTEEKCEQSVWTTDADGHFETKRIDSGTYTVTEVKVPDGYLAIRPFTVTIDAAYEQENQVSLTAESTGEKVSVKAVDAKTGIVLAEVSNAPESPPPKTGDETNLAPYLILLGIAGAGIITGTILIRKRRRK